jgi:hypothetical protein
LRVGSHHLTEIEKESNTERERERERDVKAIWGMLEVLFGGVCGDISFGSVRAGSVLEIQEGYKAR